MNIRARFDQLISTPIYNEDGEVIRKVEHDHYTIGKVGDEVSGGLYLKAGMPMPDKVVITFMESVEEADAS